MYTGECLALEPQVDKVLSKRVRMKYLLILHAL